MVKGPNTVGMSGVGATFFFLGVIKFFVKFQKEGKRCTEKIKTRNSEKSSSKTVLRVGRRIAIMQ